MEEVSKSILNAFLENTHSCELSLAFFIISLIGLIICYADLKRKFFKSFIVNTHVNTHVFKILLIVCVFSAACLIFNIAKDITQKNIAIKEREKLVQEISYFNEKEKELLKRFLDCNATTISFNLEDSSTLTTIQEKCSCINFHIGGYAGGKAIITQETFEVIKEAIKHDANKDKCKI